ncbi:MAG TPA: alpha-ketoacid dehydrogenase subunit beta [Rubrobacteraceae bacterium]|nr:alpha-ketoacid dehydrogenase subunit beta [Rubrobacteraceae bacterium]
MPTKNLLQAINEGLAEEMRSDETVMVVGEDVGRAGGVFRATHGLQEEFGPSRVMDTPLAESLVVGAAIGLSVNGMRPVAEIQFADFIPPAFDQIVNEAARFYYRSNRDWNVPLTVRIPYGAVHGGALYHSQSVEAWFCNTPGLKVVAPTFPADAKGMLKSAIRDPNPVLFFEHKRTYRLIKDDVPQDGHAVPLDTARVHREGTDLTVASYGLMLYRVLEVAQRLAEDHRIEAEVVEPRTLYPLDKGTILDSVKKTGKFLVASEANLTGSVSAEIAAIVARETFEWLDAPVMRLGAPDVPAAAFAKPMMDFFVPGGEKIEATMLELARY